MAALLLSRIMTARPTLPGRAVGQPRPSRRATAKQTVLAGVLLFILAQLAVGIASEWYPRIRDPLYGDKFVKLQRRLDARGESATTVIMLGSSRTGLAFHGQRAEAGLGEQFQKPVVAFNFGIPASGPVTHLLYWNRLLEAGVKPDLLLLEILPSMLADGQGGPLERHWFYADRVTTSEVPLLIDYGFPENSVRMRHLRSILLPAYTLRFQLMCRIVPSWLPWQVRFDWSRGADECGWGTTQSQSVDAAQRDAGIQRAHAEYAGILAQLHPGGGAMEALKKLLQSCREQQIPVRLVLMPEGSEFRSWYPPKKLATLKQTLAKLGAEFDAPLVDAQSWLPDEAFYDSHHMFAAGAEAFTDRLLAEAIVPALTRAEPQIGEEPPPASRVPEVTPR